MSDTEAKSASTQTFVTALVFNAAVFAIEIALFTFLWKRFVAIYEPRTYVPRKSKRIQPLTSSYLAWPVALFRADYSDILKINVDAYFFVRFLLMMAKVFFPMWIISWAVLLPITSVGTHVGNNDGLDRFSFGNIQGDKQVRYVAHIVLLYFFTAWLCWNIKKEMSHFIITRQKHLMDADHANTAQAATILVTGIPAKYLNRERLLSVFGKLPGGVKNIWINRNLKELPDIYDRRLAASAKLESAENKYLKTAAKQREKALKEGSKDGAAKDPEAATEAVPRPTHKLGFLGLLGKKVDSIEWAQEEIVACTNLLEEGRNKIPSASLDKEPEQSATEAYPTQNSAFIQFNQQVAAHLAKQVLAHHEPYRMSDRYIEVSPEDVVWSNLNLNPYEMKVRMVIGWAATLALIIFWAIPVAFVGIISNISKVCTMASWLAWICDIPSPVIGIISGILPPVAFAILMMLLPIVLRLFAKFQGIPTRTGVELSLMSRFFLFQVVHGFLVLTISSGIIAALQQISDNPSSTASTLASNLPLAANFFLTYVLLQGLTGTAGGFLQIVPLIIYYVKYYLLGSTPRSVWNIKFGKRGLAWGTTWPKITLLVTIALGYSLISPIMNGLACATFFAFYQLYKYLFLYVFDQSNTADTGGLFFPKAIQQIFVGMYIQQICLAGLFFLARDDSGSATSIPEGALAVVLIVFTIFFHIVLNNSYGPLIHSLPLSLSDKMYTPEVVAEPHPSKETSGNDSETHLRETTSKLSSVDNHDNGFKVLSEESYGFAHPAASRPQRIVWIAKDTLGLAREEEKSLRDAGVAVSLAGAEMNEKGKVDISRGPPDMIQEEE